MQQLDNAIKRFGKIILDDLKDQNIKCWLAGGCVRDYFMGVTVKTDFDLFFPSEEEMKKTETYLLKKGAKMVWESENGAKFRYKGNTFDLVKHYFQSPKETINAFDFTISMLAVDNEKVYYGETTFIDLAKRQLIINKIDYPASTLKRSYKYYQKGFVMCQSEMKTIYEAIQKAPKPEEDEAENEEDVSSGETSTFFSGID